MKHEPNEAKAYAMGRKSGRAEALQDVLKMLSGKLPELHQDQTMRTAGIEYAMELVEKLQENT